MFVNLEEDSVVEMKERLGTPVRPGAPINSHCNPASFDISPSWRENWRAGA